MRRYVLCAMLAVLITACGEKSKEVKVTELTGENVEVEMPFMRVPKKIMTIDDYLYVEDLVPIDTGGWHCHIMKLPEAAYIKSVGKHGQAPDEIVSPKFMQRTGDGFTLCDGPRKQMFKYNKTGRLLWQQPFDIPSPYYVHLNDTTVISGDLSGDHRIILSTPSLQKGMFSIPRDLIVDSGDDLLPFTWMSYMAYNKQLNKLALATQYGQILEIYDLSNNAVKIVGSKDVAPKSVRGESGMNYEGYQDVCWSGSDIYVLYSKNTRDAQGKKTKYNSILYQYDAEGNLKHTYNLDQYLTAFSIDEKHHLLWALADDMDNPIFKYKLQ